MKYSLLILLFLFSCAGKDGGSTKNNVDHNPFNQVDSSYAPTGSSGLENPEQKPETNTEKVEKLLKETEMVEEKLKILKKMKEDNEKLKCQIENNKKQIEENYYIKNELDSLKSILDSTRN
jgi:uncharacterized protein YhaN